MLVTFGPKLLGNPVHCTTDPFFNIFMTLFSPIKSNNLPSFWTIFQLGKMISFFVYTVTLSNRKSAAKSRGENDLLGALEALTLEIKRE